MDSVKLWMTNIWSSWSATPIWIYVVRNQLSFSEVFLLVSLSLGSRHLSLTKTVLSVLEFYRHKIAVCNGDVFMANKKVGQFSGYQPHKVILAYFLTDVFGNMNVKENICCLQWIKFLTGEWILAKIMCLSLLVPCNCKKYIRECSKCIHIL